MELIPFRFGAPVDPPWFCDREAETEVLSSRMRSGIHVFVLSPRRYGKTSLLRRAMSLVRSSGGRCAYANLLLATTETEVAQSVLQAVVRGVLGPGGRARHSLEDILRHLRVTPKVSIGADGPRVELDPAVTAGSWLEIATDAVGLLARAGGRKPTALVLDEFQAVASIGPGLGGSFKALADAARTTSIVFSGSHLSVMEMLSKGRGAPLQGMGERLVLEVIPEEPMVAYLQRRARAAGKRLSRPVGRHVYEAADTVPNYVQQLALAAFEAAGQHQTVEHEHVESGLAMVAERQAAGYAQAFEDLVRAPAQQRILKALARSPTAAVYAKTFLDAVGVANANAVTTALRALDGRELVVRRGRVWDVADPFLRRWLRTQG